MMPKISPCAFWVLWILLLLGALVISISDVYDGPLYMCDHVRTDVAMTYQHSEHDVKIVFCPTAVVRNCSFYYDEGRALLQNLPHVIPEESVVSYVGSWCEPSQYRAERSELSKGPAPNAEVKLWAKPVWQNGRMELWPARSPFTLLPFSNWLTGLATFAGTCFIAFVYAYTVEKGLC